MCLLLFYLTLSLDLLGDTCHDDGIVCVGWSLGPFVQLAENLDAKHLIDTVELEIPGFKTSNRNR